jgi:hypothetical protein
VRSPHVPRGMDALVIGPPHGLAGAVARALRREGRAVLQAIAADAADRARANWLLDEAGRPPLVVIVEGAPYATLHTLLTLTRTEIVLVAEHRVAAAGRGAAARSAPPRDAEGLTVVPLGRAGRRWFQLAARRREPMGAERAAAVVLRSCAAAAASCR